MTTTLEKRLARLEAVADPPTLPPLIITCEGYEGPPAPSPVKGGLACMVLMCDTCRKGKEDCLNENKS